MDRIFIASTAELHEWLREHGYFEEGYCLAARPTNEEYPPDYAEYLDKPDAVVLELAHQVGGGWMAGEVRVMQVFACTGEQVREWTPGVRTDPYIDSGVEVIESGDGIGLDLRHHGRLVCGRITVAVLPERSIPVEPQAYPGQVSVHVPVGRPPTPRDWLEWLRNAGEDVAWRVYGGGEQSPDDLPVERYAAFLQRRRDMPAKPGGVFIEVREPSSGHGFHLTLNGGDRWPAAGSDQTQLWQVVREALLHLPEETRYRSGNCPMSHEEWRRYVRDGILPDYAKQSRKKLDK